MALKGHSSSTIFRIFSLNVAKSPQITRSSVGKCIYSSKRPLSSQASPVYQHHDVDDNNNNHNSPMEIYKAKVQRGELKPDPHQKQIIQHLEDLHNELEGFKPEPPKADSFFSKLFSMTSSPKKRGAGTQNPEDIAAKYSNSPKGLYLYGSVGCGKTMLMDFFHHTSSVEQKQRIHFHQFMLDVHRRIHEVKKAMPMKDFNLNRSQPYDPIPPVAKEISEESWLLCFDEFQVTDIADATILKRLFSQLWKHGVVIVATSNRQPDDLYKNGLQRINFLPFIPMVKANCDVLCLDSGIDYRRQTMPAAGKIYFDSRDPETKYEMDIIYEELVSKLRKDNEGQRTLEVMGRNVVFQKTCGRVLDSTFNEMCMRPLGAIDYIEICKHFDTVLLRDIPQMDIQRRSEARRFITLIDTFYDNKMQFICSAEAQPDLLFALHDNVSDYDRHHKRILIGDLDIERGSEDELASIFTGEEELFAFERVMSRLTEMQTQDYWKQREILLKKQEKAAKKKAQAKAS